VLSSQVLGGARRRERRSKHTAQIWGSCGGRAGKSDAIIVQSRRRGEAGAAGSSSHCAHAKSGGGWCLSRLSKILAADATATQLGLDQAVVELPAQRYRRLDGRELLVLAGAGASRAGRAGRARPTAWLWQHSLESAIDRAGSIRRISGPHVHSTVLDVARPAHHGGGGRHSHIVGSGDEPCGKAWTRVRRARPISGEHGLCTRPTCMGSPSLPGVCETQMVHDLAGRGRRHVRRAPRGEQTERACRGRDSPQQRCEAAGLPSC
jgi:hypothetical protein